MRTDSPYLDFAGYAEGKGTHISFYFVIMKGEFDNILSWPFRNSVSIYHTLFFHWLISLIEWRYEHATDKMYIRC